MRKGGETRVNERGSTLLESVDRNEIFAGWRPPQFLRRGLAPRERPIRVGAASTHACLSFNHRLDVGSWEFLEGKGGYCVWTSSR